MPDPQGLVNKQRMIALCSFCKQNGRETCTHKPRPKHQDAAAIPYIKLLMQDNKMLQRETQGEILDDDCYSVFKESSIDAWLRRPEWTVNQLTDPCIIVHFIDPKGNSDEQSYLAVVSLILLPETNEKGGGIVLVGNDEEPSNRHPDQKDFLKRYFFNIMQHPICKQFNAVHIVTQESNFGTADVFYEDIFELFRTHCPSNKAYSFDDTPGKPGVRTSRSVKTKGFGELITDFESNRVYTIEQFVCTRTSRSQERIETLAEQFRSMRIDSSGKIEGKKRKAGDIRHDDSAMAIGLGRQVASRYMEIVSANLLKQQETQQSKLQTIIDQQLNSSSYSSSSSSSPY